MSLSLISREKVYHLFKETKNIGSEEHTSDKTTLNAYQLLEGFFKKPLKIWILFKTWALFLHVNMLTHVFFFFIYRFYEKHEAERDQTSRRWIASVNIQQQQQRSGPLKKQQTRKQFSTSSRWQSKPKDERMLISSNQEKRISTATGTEKKTSPVTRKCWLKSSFIKNDTFLSLPHHPHSLSLAPLPSKSSASPCADCTLVFALLSGKIFRFFSPSFFIN